ncbi:preprotein translocase subunit SecE [Angustibacter aerolatus]
MSETTGDVNEPRRGASSSRGGRGSADRLGFFARIALFVRQVVAELRKVVRPTRNELVTYTTVCLVFVVVVMAFVAGLDVGLGKIVLLVFGGGDS